MSEQTVMKESEMDGKRYRSVLRWVALPQEDNGVDRDTNGTSGRGAIEEYKTLIKEECWNTSIHFLKGKFVADVTVGFDRRDQSEEIVCSIRKSETPVNLNATKPVVQLSCQLSEGTIGLVVILMKPGTAPEGKEHELIDNSDGMGFENRLILPIIQQALFYSIDNGCCTCLRWHIEELAETERERVENAVEAIAGVPLKPKFTVTTFFGNIFAKLLAEECLQAPGGLASTMVASELALIGAKMLAHKSGARKRIYGAGVIVGGFLGAFRVWNGDVSGAAMEVSSGIISCFPGFGEAVSITLDLLLCTRYAHNTAS